MAARRGLAIPHCGLDSLSCEPSECPGPRRIGADACSSTEQVTLIPNCSPRRTIALDAHERPHAGDDDLRWDGGIAVVVVLFHLIGPSVRLQTRRVEAVAGALVADSTSASPADSALTATASGLLKLVEHMQSDSRMLARSGIRKGCPWLGP